MDVATPTSADMSSSSSSSHRDSSSCLRWTICTMRENQDSRLFLSPSWTLSRLPSNLLNITIHHSTGLWRSQRGLHANHPREACPRGNGERGSGCLLGANSCIICSQAPFAVIPSAARNPEVFTIDTVALQTKALDSSLRCAAFGMTMSASFLDIHRNCAKVPSGAA